jgi:hypothetical protein
MVQILPPPLQREKGPSGSERAASGVAALLQGASQYQQQKSMREKLNLENQQIKNTLGIDLSGISDPKQRQMAVQSALQGANQKELEMLKNQGRMGIEQYKQSEKSNRLAQNQGFLNQIFGGGQQGGQNFSEQMMGQPGQEGMPQEQGQMGMQGQQFDPAKLSDAHIAMATALDPNLGRVLQQQKDVSLREQREEKKYEFERNKLRRKEESEISKPILLELNQSRKNIPLQEQAIKDIKEAAPSVGAQDYFADVTGFEPLRSAQGAKLKTAIKDFFLSDLTRAGTRPNQWIEQQLADALPKIGRSKEANLVTAAGMEFKVDLAKKRIELLDELAEQDREKYGYVKADIDSRASKKMSKYVADRQKELETSIKKIKSEAKGKKEFVRMKSPDGSVYEILSDDVDAAKEHGYDFTE